MPAMKKKATLNAPARRQRKTFNKKTPRAALALDEDIGIRLREARIALDISQAELGARLGVSFQQVQKYEKGVNRINPRALVELAKELRIDPNYLLGWGGEVNTAQAELNAATIRLAVTLDKLTPKARGLLIKHAHDMIKDGFGVDQ